MTRHANLRADGREAIQFTDIVGPANSDLKLAVVSSFDLDHKWLAPHFNTEVPMIVLTGRKGSGPTMMRLFENPNWIQTCPKWAQEGAST